MDFSGIFFIVFLTVMTSNVNCLPHRNNLFMKRKQSDVVNSPSTWFRLSDDILHTDEIKHMQEYSDDVERNALRVLQSPQMAEEPFKCPVRWGKFPIPNDCSSYYECQSSKVKKKKCPSGKNFDKFFKKCDKLDEVDCNSETTAPSKITFKCPYSWGAYPYAEDCSKHYLCLFGKPSIQKCEKGKLFEEKKRECKDKDKVDCGSRFDPYAVTTSATTMKSKTTKKTPSTKPVRPTTTPSTTTTAKTTRTESKTTKTSPPSKPTDKQTIKTTFQPTTASILLTTDTISCDDSLITSELSTVDLATSSETNLKTEHVTETLRPTETSSTTEKDESSTNQETTLIQETTPSSTEERTFTFQSTSPSSVYETPSSIQETFSSIQEISPSIQETSPSFQETLSTIQETSPSIEETTPSPIQETTPFSTTMEMPQFDCPKPKGAYPHKENCAWYFVCKDSIASFRKCPNNTKFHKMYKQCFNEREVTCD